MNKVMSKLTVFFEEPFWVGVYEYIFEGKLEVSKITFGAEPKDYEIFDYLLHNRTKLKFSLPIKDTQIVLRINPKRMQRMIHNQLQNTGIGTKAQQALKLQQEQNKIERKSISRKVKDEILERQFELRQEKRKEKHKGR